MALGSFDELVVGLNHSEPEGGGGVDYVLGFFRLEEFRLHDSSSYMIEEEVNIPLATFNLQQIVPDVHVQLLGVYTQPLSYNTG